MEELKPGALEMQSNEPNHEVDYKRYYVQKYCYCSEKHAYCDIDACKHEYCLNERRCCGCGIRDISCEDEVCCYKNSYINKKTFCCQPGGCWYEFLKDICFFGSR